MQHALKLAVSRQTKTTRPRLLALMFLLAFGGLLAGSSAASAYVTTGDGGWVWQSPLPIGNQLEGVAFASTQIGWAVSTGGVILHTTDGGATWVAQVSGTTAELKAVACAGTSVAWAVGMSGTLVYTTDGGATWTGQSAGTGANLYAVTCADDTHAWAVGSGGVITHTSDGDTWATQASNTSAQLRGVACHGISDAWAVGSGGVIRHTSNGGSTWSAQTAAAPATVFEAVACADSSNAWAVGDGGAVECTTNGGTTWAEETSGAASSNLLGVAAASASCVWAVGTSGAVVSSTNGGQDWHAQTSGTVQHLMATACSGVSHAWAVGAAGTVIMTTDGTTWTSVSSGVSDDLNGVALLGGAPLAVGMNGAIASWDRISQEWVPRASGTNANLSGLATDGSSDACAVGAQGTILVTADGGLTWTNHHPYQVNAWLGGVSYGAARVFAVGQNGQMCFSDDHGASWWASSPGYSESLHGVTTYTLAGANCAVAVGDLGTIWLSTSNGQGWTSETSPVYSNLYAVTSFCDGADVSLWAVGAGGTILYSADGQTWTPQTSHTTASLWGVAAKGSTLFAVGDGGVIDYSADGGSTWTLEHSGTSATLNSAVVGDLDRAWVVGRFGTILYTDTDGVGTPADTQAPSAVTDLSSSTHPDPATWYTVNLPTFAWSAASDPVPGSGLKDYVYRLDQSAGTTLDITTVGTHTIGATSVTLPATADGIWCFHVCARDKAGNYGPTATCTIKIDAVAPTTIATRLPAANAAGWNKTATVSVTLQSNDGAGSGVPAGDTQYRLLGTLGWTPYTLPIVVSGDGVTSRETYSTDAVGNTETPKTFITRIDSQAPRTIAYAATIKRNRTVALAFKASDPPKGCGKATITLKIYKGSKLKKSLAVGQRATNVKATYKWHCGLAAGAYTIKVYATDLAGNRQSKVGSARLTVK
jgi:photosystem II stability/assembly factor-like uncharacterized protein